MARDKARHKRYEFLFDLEGDSDLIDKIAGLLRPGYSLADLMRDLLEARQPSDTAPAFSVNVDMTPVADVLREIDERWQHPPESTGYTATPDRSMVEPGTAGAIESGGIDMSERRRPASPKASRGVMFAVDSLPKTRTPQ